MPFPPYAHQAEALAKMQGQDIFALLMAMRTGKSKVIVDDWERDARSDSTFVIVAPAGAYRVWETEFAKHLVDPERPVIGTWDSRVGAPSIKHVLTARGRPRILIVNVEAYSRVDLIRQVSYELLSRGPSTLVVDESVSMKNIDAIRSKTLHIIRQRADKVRILTGLPTPRSPLDLWGQFEFLRPGLMGFVSYRAFEQRYAIVRNLRVGGRYTVRIPVRYTDKIEEIWDKLSPWSYRKRLEDCADIPPKLYVTREVEMTSDQKRLYDEMSATATAHIGDDDYMSSQQSVTTHLRLHQLCCGWATVDETGEVVPVPENRTRALIDLLEDYDGKAIVWCSYGRDLQKVAASLKQVFGETSTVTFWGGNRKGREEDNQRFKTDPNCRFMVATPGAGGRGRDWSEAGLIVYYSNTDNLEHRDQSEERASGMSKQDQVTIVDFATHGTVEWKIIYAMRRKIDLAAVVLNETPREWVV